MKIYLNSETIDKISNFYEKMIGSVPTVWRKEIGDFWGKGLEQISFKFNQNNRCMEIDTDRSFAHSLQKPNFIDRINIYFALWFIKKLSVIRENTELLKKVLTLSIPQNDTVLTRSISLIAFYKVFTLFTIFY